MTSKVTNTAQVWFCVLKNDYGAVEQMQRRECINMRWGMTLAYRWIVGKITTTEKEEDK